MVPRLILAVRAIEEKYSTLGCNAQGILAFEKRKLMAGDKSSGGDQVGSPDRVRSEAKMRHGLRARFMRIVDEVTLGVASGVLSDDLDAVLICTDRAISAEAVEDGSGRARILDREFRIDRQASMRDVVIDAERKSVAPCELAFRTDLTQLVERRLCHCWREILRREPVSAANHARHSAARASCEALRQGRDHVEIERLAGATGLFGLL